MRTDFRNATRQFLVKLDNDGEREPINKKWNFAQDRFGLSANTPRRESNLRRDGCFIHAVFTCECRVAHRVEEVAVEAVVCAASTRGVKRKVC